MEELIDGFLLYLAAERGLSANYQLSTQRSLETFAKWLSAVARVSKLADVEPNHFSEYLAWRKRAGLSAASIKLEAVALRVFFRFLLARKILPANPAENLSIPRIIKHLPATLDRNGISCLLESVNEGDTFGLRDRAMLELLYASG
ncbi:MAG TPA: site-specific integrase, partial [Terrimicrobiaceae bacterium]